MFSNKCSITRLVLIFLLSACLTITFNLPAQSQPDGFALAIQGQQLYRRGELTQAAVTWQAAAAAFTAEGDRLGSSKSLINKSQVLQDMGLYPQACNTVLQAFEVKNPDCSGDQVEQLIQTMEDQTRISTIEGIGLRSLGNILQRRGMLVSAQKMLKLSILAPQNSSELGATLLAMGNVQQAMGNQVRDRWNYDKITEIIDRQEPEIALEPYQSAFQAYKKVESHR